MASHSAKLIMTSSTKTKLTRWLAVSAIVAVCGAAWGLSDTVQKPLVGQNGPAAERQVSAMDQSVQATKLHDEVQYFGDKFADEQRTLQKRPTEAHVQAF